MGDETTTDRTIKNTITSLIRSELIDQEYSLLSSRFNLPGSSLVDDIEHKYRQFSEMPVDKQFDEILRGRLEIARASHDIDRVRNPSISYKAFLAIISGVAGVLAGPFILILVGGALQILFGIGDDLFLNIFGGGFAGGVAGYALDQKMGGAGCRIRTRDPLITNQVLYQLS